MPSPLPIWLLPKIMKHSKDYKNGIITLLICNTLWGVLPIYWQALRPIDSWVIIFYRIFLVGLTAGAVSLKVYGWSEIKKHLMIKRNLWLFPVTGILITCNWSIYIWAVNADHVIQTCVGYYIEPLVVCLFGLVFFKEKLTRYKSGAMLMALVGIIIILIHFGQLPTIALGLAFSFAIYAALKKNFKLPAIMSVFLETFFLMWPALGVVIYLETTGQGALATGEPGKYGLMLLCGILTATPLALFANGAKKVPLVVTGLMEYIGPSLTLIIGIFFMKEPFDSVQLIAFIFVWIGLVYFTIGEFKMPDIRTENTFYKEGALQEAFGEDYDRFRFPGDIVRVTAGQGGEALLISGKDKKVLLDCGMAYCGEQMAANVAGHTDRLDYVLLSHSHYDHIGALPYIREKFPEVVVCGSAKCASILTKESARKLIVQLGEEARNTYMPESKTEIRVDGLNIDRVLADGDFIELGDGQRITAYETLGHTDCSLSYFLEPERILFASESTGILEGIDYVHTPCLKSFSDSLESSKKCRYLSPEHICLPHFGMLPQVLLDRYFDMFDDEVERKLDFVLKMKEEGLTESQMLERYLERYWTPEKEKEQPYEAFAINAGHILKALLREL